MVTLLNRIGAFQTRIDDDHGDSLFDRRFDWWDQRLAIARGQDNRVHAFAGETFDDLLLLIAHTLLGRTLPKDLRVAALSSRLDGAGVDRFPKVVAGPFRDDRNAIFIVRFRRTT